MDDAVYILCALTSLACAALLLRSWFKTRARLLMFYVVRLMAFVVILIGIWDKNRQRPAEG